MMDLGFVGIGAGRGNSSSSTSNLSALAPPFTVDRLNSKPNSQSLLNYSDLPYSADPFNNSWGYLNPSAPNSELDIHLDKTNSLNIPDDYQFSASSNHGATLSPKISGSAFAYGGEVDPYYLPYVPPVNEERDLIEAEGNGYNMVPASGVSIASKIDYSRNSFGRDCGPRWMDSLDIGDGKQAQRVEFDGVFSSQRANVGASNIYKNHVTEGGCAIESGKRSDENSAISYGKFNPVSDRQLPTGSSVVGRMEDKSCLEQNLSFFSHESNQTRTLTYPESHPLGTSHEMHDNFSNYQNLCKYAYRYPAASRFTGSVSITRSSPTVVIRPPPPACDALGKSTASSKPAHVDFDQSNSIFFKQGSDQFFASSSSVKESNPVYTFGSKIKVQIPDINVSGVLAMPRDGVRVVSPIEDSLDVKDHQNTAVDSPCWKGASASQCSTFDIEAGTGNSKSNLEGYYGFDWENLQNLHSLDDQTNMTTVQGNKNGENKYARKSLEIKFDANFPNEEHILCEDAKSGIDLKISDIKGCNEADVGIVLNDSSECGAVAFHAAEKVLASPSSQEDVTEHMKLQVGPKVDVQIMIKAINNLSELLLLHVSDGAHVLEEENTEALKHVISNLDACISKKIVHTTNKEEMTNPVGGIVMKVGQTNNMGTVASRPYVTNKAVNSDCRLDYQQKHKEERTEKNSGKKAEKSPFFLPLKEDINTTRDDGMTKAIKEILEENFHFNEEMDSQSILFKSLWLEAEAKLCSIGYKTHFDRMKLELEKIKTRTPADNEAAAEMMSKVHISPHPSKASELSPKSQDEIIIPKLVIKSSSIPSTGENVDNVEASVMARFNILKSREGGSKSKSTKEPYLVDDELANVKKLMPPIGNRQDETLNLVTKPPIFVHPFNYLSDGRFGSYVNGSGSESGKELYLSAASDKIINQNYCSTSSSDWEHVLKDDFAWKNL